MSMSMDRYCRDMMDDMAIWEKEGSNVEELGGERKVKAVPIGNKVMLTVAEMGFDGGANLFDIHQHVQGLGLNGFPDTELVHEACAHGSHHTYPPEAYFWFVRES